MNRWQQVESICQAALELEESQRATFLAEACGGDEDLRQEVVSLLKHEKTGDHFIEEPAVEMAARMIAQEKPESLVGKTLGSYQVVSLLGTGGMGVVYKARDARLNRSVAIKVLPPDWLGDPERKQRFIQEAQAASALNHPNIITIHDIGSEGGVDFTVMEYVEGKTLDRRIPRKGMKLNEALTLAIQMADALAKAHLAGIIHRDLKPTNVMVTDDGLVKVLDFGLAKLTEVERPDGETRTLESLTEEGMIIGTVYYMSPEQADGKKVDARSDIFSFGAVLYEMVSGKKAFEGDSKMSTLAALLKQEPKPISQRVPGIPPDLEKIINRCLRKDPVRRFQHMADLRVALQELKEESESGKPVEVRSASWSPALQAVRLAGRRWAGASVALVLVAVVVAIWLFRRPARTPAAAPEVVPLTSYVGFERSPSFSPDGNQMTFSWNGEKQDNYDIYLKLVGSPNYVRLTTNPADDVSPDFSPDGQSIGFMRYSKERTNFIIIPAIGGPERVVADLPGHLVKFSWFPDGKWVVTDGLTLLSIESGETRSLTSSPQKLYPDAFPSVSPDGRTIAFSRHLESSNVSSIHLLDLTQGLTPIGEPRRLTFLKEPSVDSAWTPDGKEIVFATANVMGIGSLWKVPATGGGEPETLPYSMGEARSPVVSRNGRRLAYERRVLDNNIWRLSLSEPGVASGPANQFLGSTRGEEAAQYSPDGKQIVFESDRSGTHGIWISDADGLHPVELFSQVGKDSGDARWSPDGERIAFSSNLEGHYEIYVMRASGGTPTRLTTNSTYDDAPSWSKEGNWIYFMSARTGKDEVWKVSAGGGDAIQLTQNGGGPAIESPDGKSIYYVKGEWEGGLWKMPVNGGEESQVLPSTVRRAFCLVKTGIYFIPEPGADKKSCIEYLNLTTGKVKVVATMSGPPQEGLSVSPDGHSLLFSQTDSSGSDLMLVENFK